MASEFCRPPATDFRPVIARASARVCRLDLAALRQKAAKQPVWPMRPAASRAERRQDSPRRLADREFLISDLRQKPVSAWRSRAIAVLHSAAQKARVRLLRPRQLQVRASQSDPPAIGFFDARSAMVSSIARSTGIRTVPLFLSTQA